MDLAHCNFDLTQYYDSVKLLEGEAGRLVESGAATFEKKQVQIEHLQFPDPCVVTSYGPNCERDSTFSSYIKGCIVNSGGPVMPW